ncbi:efflux RND transporter periplasmic adaptor subunit [Methylobacter sp. S3L5C]|uniref:efflux RND transporter periplasmic adaptor subunit n=1 Tax=Methylobacter sp. S3L5C TaxID=2839024 RepID=UPI001FADE528|nr:efflux RND transporter periplasmic adaptor subunit [Methylobacter sp. S3L5C]UOA10019.1 efflux RND transporter periplasmic adaptor subunit [Methylobacter sp. S3L5C]
MRSYKFLLLLNFLGWALWFCPPANAENTFKITQAYFDNLGVTLSKLESTQQIPVLTAPAKVVVPPAHEYIVSASQAGLIIKLNAAIGDKVTKGDVLAQLNSPDLLSMQRLYLKAVNEMQLSFLSFQRDKKLLEDGVIADRRWQETLSKYNAIVSEANEYKQLLQISGMTATEIDHLGKTHQLSSQLSVHSPISGVVMERVAVAGERVNILAPLYRIANLDELWLEINIPHERIGSVKVGDQVLVENSAVIAQITLLGQSVNPENQTLLARAIILTKQLPENEQSEVRVGQTINTQIIEFSEKGAFKVPNTAIAQNEGKFYIFVRNPEGFTVSQITVKGKQGDESIITGDFSGAEDIASKGAVALKAKWLGLGSAE